MNIPNFSFSKIVNEDGYPTDEFAQFLIQMSTQLQINLSNEGYKLPQLPTTSINILGSTLETVAQTEGSILYDQTTKQFKVYLNGTWHVVTVV